MARTRGLAPLLAVIGLGVGLTACHGRVHCGDTITSNVTLTGDLTDCPGDGLVIGADGVTVDLNGHTIDGDGAQSPADFASGSAGIRATDRQDVTIFGGTIQQFDNGVSFLGTTGSTVRDLVVNDAANGVRLVGGGSNRLFRNQLGSNDEVGDYFSLVGSHGNRIENNRTEFNEFGSSAQLVDAHFNTVAGNRFTGNDSPNITLMRSNVNLIERNEAGNSNTNGIFVSEGQQNRIVNNLTDSESSGLFLVDTRQNEVVGNDAGDELAVSGSRDNFISSNTGRALRVSASTGTELIANRIDGDGFSSGIQVDAGSTGTEVRNNLVRDGTEDGIRVDQAGTVVADNSAIGNAGYGIRAVTGVVDGGGNTARENDGPAQCLNITCS